MIKQALKSTPIIGPWLKALSQRHYHWKRDPARHIRRLLGKRKQVQVVQIGSNDGVLNDPIRKTLLEHPGWRCLFVEPVPSLFERLKSNYPAEPRFRFEKAAISAQSGTAPFYYLMEEAAQVIPDLPPWRDHLGSFNPQHIEKLLGPAVRPFVASVTIPTVTLPALLERNKIDRFDLLHIDTEGHDWQILKQLDLSKHQPDVILFEHAHLSVDEKAASIAFLERNYSLNNLGFDYFCIRRH